LFGGLLLLGGCEVVDDGGFVVSGVVVVWLDCPFFLCLWVVPLWFGEAFWSGGGVEVPELVLLPVVPVPLLVLLSGEVDCPDELCPEDV